MLHRTRRCSSAAVPARTPRMEESLQPVTPRIMRIFRRLFLRVSVFIFTAHSAEK
jgi:hypothetical protein